VWIASLEARIKALEGQGQATAQSIFGAAWGSFSTAEAGWFTVTFVTPFPGTPGVVAVHGSNLTSARSQGLTPPEVAPPPNLYFPAIKAPSLASLLVSVPAAPTSWGTEIRNAIDSIAGSTIGQIPVIGGYLTSGVDGTFGAMGEYVGNALQGLYYAFDAPALFKAIAVEAENKAATDWNNGVAGIQAELDKGFSSIADSLGSFSNNVDAALASLTTVAQDSVNAVYGLLNSAIGLVEGEAIPVAKVRSVGPTGFQAYSPGSNTTVYWLAVGPGPKSA
jgi:hypothetical protein